MNKYRIDTTGITDGISNLNINLVTNNNYMSSSKDIRLSYSTKQTFIDIHAEDGQIVDTGSCAKNTNNYTLKLNSGIAVVDNTNPNKIYNQCINIPANGESDGIELYPGGNFESGKRLFSASNWTFVLTFKMYNWPTYWSDFIYLCGASGTSIDIRHVGKGASSQGVSRNNTELDGDQITTKFFEKLGQWCKLCISVKNDLTYSYYLDGEYLGSANIPSGYSGRYYSPYCICLIDYNNDVVIDVESLKVISGIWTPENQIDLE